MPKQEKENHNDFDWAGVLKSLICLCVVGIVSATISVKIQAASNDSKLDSVKATLDERAPLVTKAREMILEVESLKSTDLKHETRLNNLEEDITQRRLSEVKIANAVENLTEAVTQLNKTTRTLSEVTIRLDERVKRLEQEEDEK